MELTWSVPTRVILGDGCIEKNADRLAGIGKRAFIVTSPSSAKNGSLHDLKDAFGKQGIAYMVWDQTRPNPALASVGEIGREARAFGCDFVVGLGGGSAMDAAKGAAVLAANDMPPEGLYAQPYENKPLPVIAVPTTCGTGSEVTAVSVLTVGDNKKSFKTEDVIPRIAFLDARYIDRLPHGITVETAVDALSHAAEGYLMVDSWASDMLAEEVFAFFAACVPSLLSGQYDHEIRERLLFMAMLAGLVIVTTGTSAVHAMGYALTTLRDIPHGRACGLLLGEYTAFTYAAKKEKTDRMLSFLDVPDPEGLKKLLADLLGEGEAFSAEELERYTEITYRSAIPRANPVKMEKKDVLDLYKKALLG